MASVPGIFLHRSIFLGHWIKHSERQEPETVDHALAALHTKERYIMLLEEMRANHMDTKGKGPRRGREYNEH